MEDYKEEIRNTRLHSLGSSDGKMLLQISRLGYVPKSSYKRMAVCKGLCEQEEIPYTDAVRAGDEIEMMIYNHLKATNPLCESNPLVVSKKYSQKFCTLISHPDIRIIDEDKKTITYIEIKASKYTAEQVRQEYKGQLYIHTLLAIEEARARGKEWKAKVKLAHYNTNDLDLSSAIDFMPERLSVRDVKMPKLYDMEETMHIVNDFLETFTEYYEGEEIDAEMLPVSVKSQFEDIAHVLVEIREREDKVNNFKAKLYEFMLDKGIKSIKNDVFTITRIDPTTSKTFNHKKYIDDMMREHPRKAKKLIAQYTTLQNRKGYALIKVK